MRSRVSSASDLAFLNEPYNPIYSLFQSKPILVHQYVTLHKTPYGAKMLTFERRNTYAQPVFTQRPLLGPLLFDNNDSDARDHCAAERSQSTPPLPFPHPY